MINRIDVRGPATVLGFTPDHEADHASTLHQQPIREAISDGVITARIRAQLLASDITAGYDIHVTTSDGIVELSGFVETSAVESAAVLIAQNVDGVHDIHDEMDCRRD
jgi:osmotically-inducible protein OsmY